MKIWSIERNGVHKFYFNEESLLREARRKSSGYKINTFDLESSVDIESFINQCDRDNQIKCLLGELSEKELKDVNKRRNIDNFISVMSELNLTNTTHFRSISNLRKKPSVLSRYISDNKVEMLTLCNDVEYYKALIQLTGYKKLSKTEHVYSQRAYSRWIGGRFVTTKAKWTLVEKIVGLDQSYYDNFKKAKDEVLKKIN